MKKNIILIISGPTATGKTSLSIQLAKKFNAEIVNFDSLLFYKELNIGTAKPSMAEQDGVVHHMINIQSIDSPLNAAEYIKRAIPIINDCHQRGKVVVLVGGSGFYLQALLNGMYDSQTSSKDVLDRSDELYKKESIAPFLAVLEEHDQKSFELYHENDHYRVRRAVEHFWSTGSPFSEAREKMQTKTILNSPTKKYQWSVRHNHIDIEKEAHLKIIESRTQTMVKNGLIDEVKSILHAGHSEKSKPLQSIGYKESIDYLRGLYPTEAEYIDKININTRKLAKAQRTWFKKKETYLYNSLEDKKRLEDDCHLFINDL